MDRIIGCNFLNINQNEAGKNNQSYQTNSSSLQDINHIISLQNTLLTHFGFLEVQYFKQLWHDYLFASFI
jgi:hypothetical protein